METLVAITLLLLAIGGPMYAVSQSLSSAIYARDQVTAFYLAQDAVEYVRNMRDNNALNNRDWLSSVKQYVPSDGSVGSPFKIDTQTGTITDCAGACPAMSYTSNGIYNYDPVDNANVTQSPFTRTITLQMPDKNQNPANEIRMTVDISWRQNIAGARNQFKVVENLTSWVQ